MIELIDIYPGNIIGCRIDGNIDLEDIQKITQSVDEKSVQYPKLRVNVEVTNLGGISLEALLKDFRLAIKQYSKFERKAVVTDKKWMHKLTPIINKIFSGVDVRCFTFEDREKAVEWIKA